LQKFAHLHHHPNYTWNVADMRHQDHRMMYWKNNVLQNMIHCIWCCKQESILPNIRIIKSSILVQYKSLGAMPYSRRLATQFLKHSIDILTKFTRNVKNSGSVFPV